MPGSAAVLPVGDELAVAAIAHPFGGGLVPEVAAGRPGDLVEGPLRRIRNAAIAAIAQRPDPLDEIGGISPHRPFVAVGADLALDVEVVQQHELAGQGVVVGRDRLGKQAEVRIAVAFLHVAEDLVVGAVFLDDVDDVLDRRRLADLGGDRVARRGARSAARRSDRLAAAGCTRRPFANKPPSAGAPAWGWSRASPGRARRCIPGSGCGRRRSPAAGRRDWRASWHPCRWSRRSSCRREPAAPRWDTSRPG